MINKNNYILIGIIEMIKTTFKKTSILFLIISLLIISCGDSSDSITGGESVGPPPEWPEEE